MPAEPGKIRNVAVVGHRGTGKTSLVEAMLFQAGAVNRLGTIEAGTTVSDWDDDEQKRQMSLAGSICHLEWQGRKINLIDTPGDPGFQGDAVAALRVVEGALFTVSGVMGVEVQTSRLWKRADELALARLLYVNMLDRERADFFRVLGALREQLSEKCVAVHIPIGSEHELTGIVDVLHMCAYTSPDGGKEGDPSPIPDELQAQAQEYREKLLDAEQSGLELPTIDFPEPVMSFAITPKTKGDEEKVATSLRRLSEEDPTLQLRRDQQTGEQLLSGLSQMHVEVAVERLKRRFGAEVEPHPPRVPYLETIRKEARAQGRYKKQTGGRGQYGDAHIVLEPLEGHTGYEFVDEIVGGVIPQSFRPAVDKGIQEAMQRGELAGAPVQGVKVRLVDGSYHTVDSSEMAFKIAGSLAFKTAYEKANPVLLEPIMDLEVTVPDESVGAVNGDLNSRRGRLQGMEPQGGMTTIKAEVPMSEILTYSQALTSMTGGRGDYHMQFLRYEEVPAHIAQKVIAETKKEKEEAAV